MSERLPAPLRSALARLREAEIPLIASSLAFSTLLSMIPFIAVAVAMVKSIRGLDQLGPVLEGFVLSSLKGVAGPEIGWVVRKILGRISRGSWGVLSAIALFLTSFKLFLDIETAVNRIFRTTRERAWAKRLALITGFYLVVPLGLSLFLGLRSIGVIKSAIKSAPWVSDLLITWVAMVALIHWLPARRPGWLANFTGALVSALGLFFLGKTYAWVTQTFFLFGKIYGSLAAFPLLCLWILWAWQLVLLGVAIAAAWSASSRDIRL